MIEAVAKVLFEEAAAFLDDDHILAQFGKLSQDFHVDRVAHAHLKNGKPVAKAKIGQDMFEIRPAHAGDDEAEGG